MQPERTPGLWLLTGNHVLEVDVVKSGEAEKDKIWALQRFAKVWSTYDLTIYMDGSTTNRTGGGDSQSVLLRIVNPQPAIPLKYADESDILNLLAAIHD